jgi:hypothetical protein
MGEVVRLVCRLRIVALLLAVLVVMQVGVHPSLCYRTIRLQAHAE